MITRTPKPLQKFLLVILLAVRLQPAFAHDTYQTTALAKVTATELEVQLAMSFQGANALLSQAGSEGERLNFTNFDTVQPRLAELTAGLIEVTANNVGLKVKDAKVISGEEGHVEFLLVYPRPAGDQVKLDAAYLARLGRGFYAELTLLDEAGRGPVIVLSEHNVPVVTWPLKRAEGASLDAPPPAFRDEKVASEESPAVASAESLNEAPVKKPASAAETMLADHRSEQKDAASGETTFYAMIFVALVCLAGVVAWRLRPKAAR